MEIQQEIKQDRISRRLIQVTDAAISLALLTGVFLILIYTAFYIVELIEDAFTRTSTRIVHDIVFLVVLVKAYRLLIYYFRTHHVSIKYIIEISIIAPAIEFIFAAEERDIWLNVVLGIYSIINLVIYVLHYEELKDITLDARRPRKGKDATPI